MVFVVKDIIVIYRKNVTILILISLKRYFFHPVWLRRFAWAVFARMSNKYKNLMKWLIYSLSAFFYLSFYVLVNTFSDM